MELTNGCNVSVDWQNGSPRNGGKVGPLVVHRTWSGGENLVEQGEENEPNDLRYDTRRQGKTLQDEVGNVEVGCGWQLLCQQSRDGGWVVGDILDDGRSSRSKGDDKEDLDDLESEIGVLGEELNARESWLARELGADTHDDWNQRHEN